MKNLKRYNTFLKVLEQADILKSKGSGDLKPPVNLKEKFDLSLTENSTDTDTDTIIESIFKHSVNTQNPRFLNQLIGGTREEAWIGELITAILNTSMATYEIAPLATLLEKEIICTINKEVGFPQFEGLIVPGGSYANMLGINCARYHHDPNSKKTGMYEKKKQIVFISEDAHYSSYKSLALLGLGTEYLRRIKTLSNKKMCLDDLKSQIKLVKEEGYQPICVVSTSGTTIWGAFDPIADTNAICREEGLWHHVDAAWGGLGLFSEKKDQLFAGIEKVDSITLDFHKLMASTLTKGIFLTSRPEVLKAANRGGGNRYIFHEERDIDIGTYSLQCGRKVDSISIWLQWKLNGTVHYRNKITELYQLQNWIVDELSHRPGYRLMATPSYMNICFQLLPDDNRDISEFNILARKKVIERGNFMVNYASDNEANYFFRLVLNHWDVNQAIIEELFEELDRVFELI